MRHTFQVHFLIDNECSVLFQHLSHNSYYHLSCLQQQKYECEGEDRGFDGQCCLFACLEQN